LEVVMGRRGHSTVTAQVDVELYEFDDLAILERAAEIIKDHANAKEPNAGYAAAHETWKETRDMVSRVAAACGIDITGLPPRSTAADIQTPEALKSLFAGGGYVPVPHG
jgi:hypothetical protein